MKELNLIYKDKDDEIRIFGDDFVKNNKDNYKIVIKERIYELCSKIKKDKIEVNKEGYFEIKLNGIKNIIKAKSMFSSCSSLTSLPNIDKWDTSKVTDMGCMFKSCSSLTSLPNIYKL